MGVKVRGVSKVSNNINRLIDNIEKRKTMRALYSALFEIGLESAVLVPSIPALWLTLSLERLLSRATD